MHITTYDVVYNSKKIKSAKVNTFFSIELYESLLLLSRIFKNSGFDTL